MASYDAPDTIYDDPNTKYNELNLGGTASTTFTLSVTPNGFGNIGGSTTLTFDLNALGEIVAAALVTFSVTGRLVASPFGPPDIVGGIIYELGSGTGLIIYETSSSAADLPYEEGLDN